MDKKSYKTCPIKSCSGVLLDIDDNIVDIISLFWKKRYNTLYSCAGHFYEKQMTPYIMFGERIKHNIKGIKPAARLNRIRGLHQKALDLSSKIKTSENHPYCVLDISNLEEKEKRVPYINDAVPFLCFTIKVCSKIERDFKDLVKIRTQSFFLEYMYNFFKEIQNEI